jgi:hypothetical protein
VRELDVGKSEDAKHNRVSSESNRDAEAEGLEGDTNDGSAERLPCRLSASIMGLEWFIYNRTPAYDSIIVGLTQEDGAEATTVAPEDGEERGSEGLKKRIPSKFGGNLEDITPVTSADWIGTSPSTEKGAQLAPQDTRASSSQEPTPSENLESNIFLQFLPIHVDCTKAAVVLGNENTKSVLITKVDKASGEIDATKCQHPDKYRQLINFHFEHPVVQIKPNDDYKEDQTTAGSRAKNGSKEQPPISDIAVSRYLFFRRYRRRAWHRLQNLVPYFRTSVESFLSASADEQGATNGIPNSNQWQGLSRYLDENEQDDKARWSSVEYATVSTIVDSPSASMSYYWDIAGIVPDEPAFSQTRLKTAKSNINGDTPPQWGLELSLQGAIINYGPWADRQRADLQKVFFPTLCKDVKPAKMLHPGQTRVATSFKVYIQLDEETILRVPIREESKNWKWKRQPDTMGQRMDDQNQRRGKGERKNKTDKSGPGPEIRPFGWLDVKVSENATVTYSMDMVAGISGYSNKLELDLPNTEITTSVNHGLLWKSVDQHLTCDLSNPLEWNGPHSWSFDIISNGLELFILREHVFLLIDLVDDWASGPPPEYLTFSPFRYLLNLRFRDFRLYLNANDSNIINNPSDFDDNTFVIIFGTALAADVCIPLDRFRPSRNDISFDITAHTGGLNLHVPPWNTQASFLSSTELAQLKDLGIKGKYQYCSTTSPSNTDTLLLDVRGKALEAQIYGFLIRYFLKIKDNYFGDDIHFKTLEEYQQVLHATEDRTEVDPTTLQTHKKSNDLDVILGMHVDDISAVLPANLYSPKNHVRIDIAALKLDLRFTNYYMDMQLVLCPLAFSLGNENDGTRTPMSAASSSQLFINGIDIFGHRVFGLPHLEPTYVCNWDFAIGAITGECTTDFLGRLVAGSRAFGFSFDDDENALPSISVMILHDVTFLRAIVDSIRVWVHVEEAAFLFSTGTLQVNFDDWAGSTFSEKLQVELPNLVLACVDGESASRHRARALHPVETHAYFQTTISISMVERKRDFSEDRKLQQLHIQREDCRTHRADFLLHQYALHGVSNIVPEQVDAPAMCFPPLPPPLTRDDIVGLRDRSSMSSESSIHRHKNVIRRKSSFLSSSSSSHSSQKSILRPHSKLSVHFQRSRFTGDSRSRSRTAQAQGTPHLRDLSASTGRQSSFYSAIGEHSDRRFVGQSSVTFSSAHMAPYFPLEAVQPDRSYVPDSDVGEQELDDLGADSPSYLGDEKFEDEAVYTSLWVNLKHGVRGFCSPAAVSALAHLMKSLQAVEPSDIMDVLQIDSITDIFEANKKKMVSRIRTDLKVTIPMFHVRFVNNMALDSHERTDQYDFSVSGLSITARSGFSPDHISDSERGKSKSVVHIRLKSADFSAKQRFDDLEDAQAAVSAGIEDVVFWMVSSDSVSANLNVRAVEVATTSRKVEYLATLVHRTTVLATGFGDMFSTMASQQRNRIQLFTFLVATAGSQASDPLFLTRPSYVLRSAPDHLRIKDSWKIVTRLRHMYYSLDSATQNDIAMRCLNNNETCPEDVRQQVIRGFHQWRSWDLDNLTDCIMALKVFGPSENVVVAEAEDGSLIHFDLCCGAIGFVLDPGPKQNEILLKRLSTKITVITPMWEVRVEKTKVVEEAAAAVKTTTLQLYCVDASINLNWEICELVENILRLYTQSQSENDHAAESLLPPIQEQLTQRLQAHQIHVIVATERGSVTLDTINLRVILISEGLKSTILIDENSIENTNTINFMIAAEAATSKVYSHSQELILSQLRSPSVYISHDIEELDIVINKTWRVAANCRELSFVISQDTLALLEVADLLVGDEMAQFYRLSLQIPASPQKKRKLDVPKPAVKSVDRVHVALFLDMYHFSIPLLQSLTYSISGVVARASVAAKIGSEVLFDFDIKEHAHDIQTLIGNKTRSISLLQMPPINGRVTNHSGVQEHMVSVFASVEPIQLDGAAIHSLLAALNRPEISSVVGDIRQSVGGIRKHSEEIFGDSKKPVAQPASESYKPVIYDAHLTFAGLNVYADTSGGRSDQKTARLSFDVGCVQLEATNRLEQHGPSLPFPEVRIVLRHIMFELSRLSPNGMEPCGNFSFAAYLIASSKKSASGEDVRSYHVKSDGLEINLFAETASTVVDVTGHLQERIKDLDLTREVQYLQKLRNPPPRITISEESSDRDSNLGSDNLFSTTYSLELLKIQISWIVSNSLGNSSKGKEREDLVLSFKRIDLSTRKENSARLAIEDFQLQMVPASHNKTIRSQNSALLPEVIFNVAYVSTIDARKLAFQAAGKSLDLRLTSQFMIPASDLKKSIESASEMVRAASASWTTSPIVTENSDVKRKPFFGNKRMESLLVDADFAGAIVHLQNKKNDNLSNHTGIRIGRAPEGGRYGQFSQEDPSSNTVLRAPGLAFKIEFKDNGLDDPSLNAEVKVDASTNILYPTVVPLIMEISDTVREVVSDEESPKILQPKSSPQKFMSSDEDNILTADPSAMLGRTHLNLGLRICKQEFSLSCQPIARVAATAKFDDIYITINTVRSSEHGHFFAISAAFTRLQASVQHVYSRESTGSFEVKSIVLSLMNSKHVSGTSGLSAILNISPMKVLVNAKQLQDFLLFREIWVPPEIRQSSEPADQIPSMSQSQTFLVQRYQEVAATGAFPWNATVSIAELDVQLDLGQAIGKSAFMISKFWISSKKNSDWEQNLCLGFEKIGVDSTGRMSGFVALQDFRVRTSIKWPEREKAINQTPLVQGSLSFSQFRMKAAFDYQPFLVADITKFEFLMYNVRNNGKATGDRLVAILDGDAVQVFCTATTASQGLALYQAFQRIVQEKRMNYEASLKEIERFMKRKYIAPSALPSAHSLSPVGEDEMSKSPVSLHTDVVVTLKAVNIGAFPNTFFDQQVFKLEALNAQARFAVTMASGKIHSGLGLTLGQLRIGLAGVKRPTIAKNSGEVTVEEVVESATGSRGGTILKVPKVEATMETWQSPNSNHIDYIFKSSFEGKVEVGWNYSRISYIRSMYANHTRALALRLGKPLPPSAVKITGVPDADADGNKRKDGEQQKITAEVTVPQSKYEYFALEPPIIETPQLRDMGEATPPLEWIGLHRDRLPNLTHQIVIVTLLEVASEVEDAYSKILGSS